MLQFLEKNRKWHKNIYEKGRGYQGDCSAKGVVTVFEGLRGYQAISSMAN